MVALGIDISDGGVTTSVGRSRQVGFEIEPIVTSFVSFLFAFFGGTAGLF